MTDLLALLAIIIGSWAIRGSAISIGDGGGGGGAGGGGGGAGGGGAGGAPGGFTIDMVFPSGEQSAFTMFVIMTFSFCLVDAFPLVVWPLVRWASPPSVSEAVSAAVNTIKPRPFWKGETGRRSPNSTSDGATGSASEGGGIEASAAPLGGGVPVRSAAIGRRADPEAANRPMLAAEISPAL